MQALTDLPIPREFVPDVKFTCLSHIPILISIWLGRNYKIKAPCGPVVKVTNSRLGNASFSESPSDTLIQSHHNVEI